MSPDLLLKVESGDFVNEDMEYMRVWRVYARTQDFLSKLEASLLKYKKPSPNATEEKQQRWKELLGKFRSTSRNETKHALMRTLLSEAVPRMPQSELNSLVRSAEIEERQLGHELEVQSIVEASQGKIRHDSEQTRQFLVDTFFQYIEQENIEHLPGGKYKCRKLIDYLKLWENKVDGAFNLLLDLVALEGMTLEREIV